MNQQRLRKRPHAFQVQKLISLFVLFLSFTAQAQRGRNSSGVNFFVEGQYGKQDNLNLVLGLNDLPATSKFGAGFGTEAFFRFNRFETGIAGRFASSGRSDAGDRLRQTSGLSDLNFKYHFPFRKGSFYPLIGVGFGGAKTEVSQRNGPTNLTAAFAARNTTTLFNRQGYAVAGAGIRLFPDNDRGYFTLESGYRIGFGATLWSTDEIASDYMSSSVTDELRQVYLKLGIGFSKRRK